ncbi:hypothetical protein [Arenimonas sp. MALMAid1274]|uniref:hypothetical protein n=1 Tax=Arenimonas sp. MALMAid1274 TaxID=3411630 RepID=UPI003B9EA5A8
MEKLKIGAVAFIGAFLGAVLLWLFQGHSLRVLPGEMSYSDFVAIILSALSLLVTVLGLGLAFFAIWGWTQFQKNVKTVVNKAMPVYVAQELKEGGARQVLDDLVIKFFRSELAKPGVAEAWDAERKRRIEELEALDDDAENRE